MGKTNFIFYFIALQLIIFLVPPQVSYSCVGRHLTIGCLDIPEQILVANMLKTLINTRTGTAVTIKGFSSIEEVYQALRQGEIQIYIEYTGVALHQVLNGRPITDPDRVYYLVKRAYEKSYNIIWLKRLGFESLSPLFSSERKMGLPLEAAPIVQRKTLQNYPALPRLLNKLAGKITQAALKHLLDEAETDKTKLARLADNYLLSLGITFSFTPGQG